VDDAVSGIVCVASVERVKVWIPVEVAVVMVSVRPFDDDVANDCPATVLPLILVTPPPAPASAPQEKVPFAQRSLSEEREQLASPAPKRLKRVVVALAVREFVVRMLEVRLVADVVPRDEVRDVRTLVVREDADVVPRVAIVE
jgi:hypothetical protein